MLTDEYLKEVWEELGMLTTSWAQYELELFYLFQDVTRLDAARGRIIWFNITSLRGKIDITERLLEVGPPMRSVAEIKVELEKDRKLCARRNRYVHGTYMTVEGKEGLVLAALRELDYETTERSVRPKEMQAFSREVLDSMERLSNLRKEREEREQAWCRRKDERRRAKLVKTDSDDETKG